jgi:hypothetical protein
VFLFHRYGKKPQNLVLLFIIGVEVLDTESCLARWTKGPTSGANDHWPHLRPYVWPFPIVWPFSIHLVFVCPCLAFQSETGVRFRISGFRFRVSGFGFQISGCVLPFNPQPLHPIARHRSQETDFFIDHLLVRIYFII